jgi:hypothetical protein
MPSPRANFECRSKCQATYEDLPVASVRCPVCGFKRGFRRLYDTIQVSTTGHRIATVLDPMMQPQFEQMDKTKAETKASEARIAADYDRMLHEHPQVRAQAPPRPVQWLGAKAGLGLADAAARSDSARYIWPTLKHRVVPKPF